MPKVYGNNPHNRKAGICVRLDEDTYIDICTLAHSMHESNSYLYRELLRGAVKALELAKENPQLLEGNPTLTRLCEAPRYDKVDAPAYERLQVHDILARMVELESEVKRLNEEKRDS